MPKRMRLALPCLTALGLLAGCAGVPGQPALDASVAQNLDNPQSTDNQPAGPRRLPAVPPLPEGPESPLLQLGLVIPTPRPEVHRSHTSQLVETIVENEAPTDAGATTGAPAQVSDASLNEQAYQAAAGASLPDAAQTSPSDIAVDGASATSVAALAPIQSLIATQPVDLVTQAAMAAPLPSAEEIASADLAQVELSPLPATIDLPVAINFDVTLPESEEEIATIATGETAAAPADEIVADALPPAEPRRRPRHLAAAAPKSKPLAEGGPELPFKLRR